MQKQDIEPNTITYTTMISGLAKAGNILEADRLLKKFKSSGGTPNAACYNAMIEGLSRANREIEAYQLFEEVRSRGCEIYNKTCVILLGALQRAEYEEEAAIVDAIFKEATRSPNV